MSRWTTLLCAVLLGGAATAAEVDVDVATRRVYVGAPFAVKVSITDYRNFEEPQFPENLDGLTVLAGPVTGTSTYVSTINGRMRQTRSATFTWQLMADRAGEVTIPALTVTADGREHRTAPIRIVAEKSDAGDLLIVEVAAAEDAYYLGQTIEVTLKVWLKVYRDERIRRPIDLRTMARFINFRGSTWGVFARGINNDEMTGLLETRDSGDGGPAEYYLYQVPASITPQQSGFLTFDEVMVRVDYPERPRRGWSILGDEYDTRPLAARAQAQPIRIMPPPTEGRPPAFAGAVGRYEFSVTAKPTEVAAGDPITLTMTIDDRSQPATDLDVLSPPSLETVPGLAQDFRIAGEPPAGIVQGRVKTFTQTIRPRGDEVTSIPAIPFAYFDPERRRYVTAQSDPIPIDVRPAAVLSDADIVGGAARESEITELTEVAGGILANYAGPELLVSAPPLTLTWAHAAGAAAPPLIFAIVAAGRLRARGRDGGHARRRRAGRRALRRLEEAGQADARRQAEITAAALADYVADRCNLPAGALTAAEVVGRLQAAAVAPDLLDEVRRVLSECETLRYAGTAESNADSISLRATQCVRRLERVRLR